MSGEASWGVPQSERNGDLTDGLDVHNTVPPIESLIGRYIWAESGWDSTGPDGPQLDRGFNLRVDDAQAPLEFPNVHGEFSLYDQTGSLTGVKRVQSWNEGGPEAWQFEIEWPEDDSVELVFPSAARVYVGKVLDDNGFPFLESATGEAVGFSDSEKKRLNFLSNAMQQAERDREDKERKEEAEAARIEAAKEKPEKQQGPQMSKGERKRANKTRRLEEERARLEREQSKFDLLKDIRSHGTDLSKDHVSVATGIKLETDAKKGIKVDQPPNSSIKQEEFGPSLVQSRGIKRECDEETHTHKPVKRIKTEA